MRRLRGQSINVRPIAPAAALLTPAFDAYRYLDTHVRGGYQFLMQNYNAGDRICLFGRAPRCSGRSADVGLTRKAHIGFSRGAYTARALAGMLHKVSSTSPETAEIDKTDV